MNKLPPVWVISLRRSTERRAYITNHLSQLGIPFEIIDAVDGRELSAAQLAESYCANGARQTIGREMTAGEIGCALSHLQLYRRMVADDIEIALILEDDAQIQTSLTTLLARLAEFPTDWQIVLLQYYGGLISWWGRSKIAPKQRLGRFIWPAFGTAGYLIRQETARQILDSAFPVYAPSDHWTGGFVLDFAVYGTEPLCIRQYRDYDPDYSTIPDRDAYRQKAGFPVLNGLSLKLYQIKQRLNSTYHRFHPGKMKKRIV